MTIEDAMPGWDLLRSQLSGTLRTDAWRTVGSWAVDRLEEYLGADWAEEVMRTDDPLRRYLALAPFHRHAFAWLTELALRLTQIKNSNGRARILSSLKRDRRLDAVAHCQLMLEVGTLAKTIGADIAFEVSSPGHPSPIDLVISTPSGGEMPVEMFIIFTDQHWRVAQANAELISRQWLYIQATRNLTIDLRIEDPHYDTDYITALMEEVADEADRTSFETARDWDTGAIIARRSDHGSLGRIDWPALTADGWRRAGQRISEKAAKDYGPVPAWLRVDILDGLWQFTPWADEPLANKVRLLADQIHIDLADNSNVAGVVVTSGAAQVQGLADEVFRDDESGITAIRRHLAASRGRETLIVPHHPTAEPDVDLWVNLYAFEPAWLDDGLSSLGLPDSQQLF